MNARQRRKEMRDREKDELKKLLMISKGRCPFCGSHDIEDVGFVTVKKRS